MTQREENNEELEEKDEKWILSKENEIGMDNKEKD